MSVIMLIDNGSAKPEATLKLRALAGQLGERVNRPVYAVSLQHADKISLKDLNNTPANLFSAFIAEQIKQGARSFIALPLFFGKSRALTSFVPEQIEKLKAELGDFDFQLANEIYPLETGETLLAEILNQQIQQGINELGSTDRVVVVDHGSPIPQITEVRRRVVAEIESISSLAIDQAVMERREGKDYDFNGLLLEEYLMQCAEQDAKQIVVGMMFFLPGRHAGEGGDVEQICQRVMQKYPDLAVHITPLISAHPQLLSILQARLASCS